MEIRVVKDAIDITPNKVKMIPYINASVLIPSVPINIKLLIIDEDKNNTVHKKQNIITAINFDEYIFILLFLIYQIVFLNFRMLFYLDK